MHKTFLRIGIFTTLSAALFFCSLLRSENLIQSVTVSQNTLRVVAHKEFTDAYLNSNFFAEYDKSIKLAQLPPTIQIIPFLLNVAPVIWISGKNYTVDAIDQDLYESLTTLQKVFQAFYPHAQWNGRLIPKKIVKNYIKRPSKMTAVLFSHGLDAVYTSLRNHTQKQLLITVCGSDIGIHKTTMWNNVKEHCTSFAQEYGHANAFVRSNFNIFRNFSYLTKLTNGEIGNWFGQTSQSIGYIGLAAPIAYARGCSKILFASTRTSDNPFPYGTHPVIDNNIAFAGISVEHDGPEADRLAKIRHIADICACNGFNKPFLRVCWGNDPLGGNCNQCEKCFRTIVELLVEGQVPSEYGFALDMPTALACAQAQAPGKKKLDAGLMWHWRCIQQQAQKADQKDLNITDPAWNDFIAWMAQLDLSKFKKEHTRQRTAQEKEAFAFLWHKAVNRTFTTDDLNLLQTITRSNPISST